MGNLEIFPLVGEEELSPETDLTGWITDRYSPRDGDVLVVSSKAVSKIEGHMVRGEDVVPSAFAHVLAERIHREPVYCEIVLRESQDIVRMADGVVLCRTHHGFVLANAGVDASNCPDGSFAILPPEPDASAARLRASVFARTGKTVAVILSDTFGRAWRIGQTDAAIGVAGMCPLRSYSGTTDHQGRTLHWTYMADADELAAAAELVRGKDGRVPVVVIRGYEAVGSGGISDLLMPPERDLFR